MKRLALIIASLLAVVGCQKAAPPQEMATPQPTPAAAPAAPQGGNGTAIRQYTPTNLGGITPVQGSENLEGSPSAAGSILKDRAKHLPGGSMGAPPEAPTDGGEPAPQ